MQKLLNVLGEQNSISLTKSDVDGIEEHVEGDLMSVSEFPGEYIEIRILNVGQIKIPEETMEDVEYYDELSSFHLIFPHTEIWISGG